MRSLTLFLPLTALAIAVGFAVAACGDTAGTSQTGTPAAPSGAPADEGTPLPGGNWTITFPDAPKNGFSFISRADERIVGSLAVGGTEAQLGSAVVDVDAGTMTDGSFAISVDKMRTGNSTRDEHLRSPDWLNASQHPQIRLFDLSATRVEGTSTLWTLTGQIEVKGSAQPFETVANLRYYDNFPGFGDNAVRVFAAFPVNLKAHGLTNEMIGTPMVSEVWDVEVTAFGLLTPHSAD